MVSKWCSKGETPLAPPKGGGITVAHPLIASPLHQGQEQRVCQRGSRPPDSMLFRVRATERRRCAASIFARAPRSLVVGSMPRFTYGAHAGRACVVPRVVPNGTDPGAL